VFAATDKPMRSIESRRSGLPRAIRVLTSHAIEPLEGAATDSHDASMVHGLGEHELVLSDGNRVRLCPPRTRDVLEAAGVADLVEVRVDRIVAA
jgi:hypothetical protein